MMNNRTSERHLQAIAIKAANLLLPFSWKVWFWGDNVGFDGLLDTSELTGLGTYSGFVYGIFKGWLARESFRSEFDYNAPGVALLRVFDQTGDANLFSAAKRHADYLSGFRKTDSGAYMRYENAAFELPPELPSDHMDAFAAEQLRSQVKDGGPCIFVDSMHVEGPFFAKMHRITGDEFYRQLALQSLTSQVDLLFDPAKELFNHFWIEQTKSPNGVFWGRGNCWGLLGLLETMDQLPENDPEIKPLQGVLVRVVERMAQLQESNGGWHTVLDDPSSYVETSISAFMVAVLARSMMRSWIEPSRYEPVMGSAMSFLLDHVRDDGLLEGVSFETFPSTRIEHYRTLSLNGMVPWGQGALLVALKAYADLHGINQFNGERIGGK
ncbi:MAG: glycoside hydrolase family 88 protein [Acidobacteriaceae bacterium]